MLTTWAFLLHQTNVSADTERHQMKIEYKVRTINRYIVTRYEQNDKNGISGCESKGEFDNFDTAYAVGYALAKEDTAKLGLSPGDETVMYPNAEPLSLKDVEPQPVK